MKRSVKHLVLLTSSVLICSGMHGFAYAQAVPLPGSAEPARIQEQLTIPKTKEAPSIIAPDTQAIDETIPLAPDGFLLDGIEMKGITAFEQNYFDELISEYIGRPVDLQVLNHLGARITKTYRDNGYFLSRAIIPEQEVQNGIITIQIIEARIGEVKIDDPDGLLSNDTLDIVSKTISRIKALDPLHGPTLERYVLLLNDSAGLTIQNILQAPEKQEAAPGTVNIILKVSKKEDTASLRYNNFGSRFVGPHQLSASYMIGHILNSFDQLLFQISSSLPMREVQFGSFEYQIPLSEEGLLASFAARYSQSEPGLYLKNWDVEGDSVSFDASLSYPLIRSRRQNFIVGTALSIKNSATEFLDEKLIDDKIRALSLSADYNKQNSFGGQSAINLTLSKGLDILAATETGEDKLSRTQGRSDFVKAEINISHLQPISTDWKLIGSFHGQYAPHPLLSSEEFGYGGTDYGRAYDPSEITGDQGAAGSIELLYTSLLPIKDLNLKITPFAFYDIGKVWNEDKGVKPISAASAGFGAYYGFNEVFSGTIQAAYPLTKSVSTPVMNGSSGPRILFELKARF